MSAVFQSDSLSVERFALGPLETNAYLLVNTRTQGCFIVDPGDGPAKLIARVRVAGHLPRAIVLTHAHYDHIAGVAQVRRELGKDLPIWIHEAEQTYPTDPMQNLSGRFGPGFMAPEPTDLFAHGHILDLDGLKFEVRHSPGHSPGGVALVQHDNHVVIAGDSLFAGSVGRHDFPHSDGQALFKSIRTQFYTLADDFLVLPGHGPETTIGEEKQFNGFVRG